MKFLVALLLWVVPFMVTAHSQSPGFETEYAIASVHTKTYELENTYNFPITLEIVVYEKDFSPASGWRTEKSTYKMKPKSEKQVHIQFKSVGTRKLLVCSELKGIGYDEKEPSIISRVCSRLIINGVSEQHSNK
jgi:hypothetical protein